MSNEEIIKSVKLLENPSPALRQLALEQLAPFVKEEVVKQKIIQALKDSDHEVRTYAAEILGNIDDSQVLIALSQTLEDESWEVRQATIESFGRLKNSDTFSFIIHSLKDEHPQVRYSAARALKNFDDISMIEPLFESLRDTTESVREEAKSTILRFPIKVPASLVASFVLDSNKLVKEVVVEFLTYRVEGNPVPHLVKAYDDQDWEIRLQVLQEIKKLIDVGEIEDTRIYEVNLRALDDEHSRVRFEAISNIGALKDPNALDILGEIARNDEDSNNRLMATETMTTIRRTMRLD
jgi:HEAT repeat protein